MTAICGLRHFHGKPDTARDCTRMQRALAIYGNDRQGAWDGGEIALGIGLSHLTPEDRLDRQPLSGSGRYRLVADLRLDNRTELASLLGFSADEARVRADADFVLAAWERWQEGALDHLIGDFALAVWDTAEKRLFLARDFIGNRPLFYHQSDDRFGFASMAKGLHALPDVPIEPDMDTLRDQLALLPMRGPQSHFAGISRVEPGHLVIVEPDGRAHSRAWYAWRLDRQSPFKDDRETVEAFCSLFERAVADRLRAIGPVGSQLSSGFDSTAVTATAARLLEPSGKRLSAYTHVPLSGVPLHEPKGRIANEWPLAHKLAERYPNIDHVAVEAADRQIGGEFDAQFFYTEVPIINPCNAVWVNEIFRQAARRKEKIVLSGTMGNATISQDGLPRLPELLLAGHLRTWWREAAEMVHHGHSWLGAIGGSSILPLLPSSLVGLVRRAFGHKRWRLTNYTALRADIAVSASFRAHVKALGYDPTFASWRNRRAVSAFIMRRVDRGAHFKGILGAFGVEERDPTADRRLVEFVSSLPSEMFLREGVKKWLYRQAFADCIPLEILSEKRKGYQGADWLVRLRAQGETLRSHASEALGNDRVASLIDVEGLARLLDEPLPERADVDVMERYRLKLFRGLSLAHFIGKTQRTNDYTP